MRILIIRGGALGDFIVTLPTLGLLRGRWPDAHIELLGHPSLGEIAVHRYYLDAVRSVNHGPLSSFFMPRTVLDPSWMDYIGSFDLVLSFFYDPDRLFETNLKRCEPGRILAHSPQVPKGWNQPASRYFAGILEPLGLALGERAASEVFPLAQDIDAAQAFLTGLNPGTRFVAVHPGSGGENKNWPIEAWGKLGRDLCQACDDVTLLLVEGEADGERAQFLLGTWAGLPYLRARWLPLPILAAVLREARLFLGHDSGISHLAAACREDLPVIALFGSTDPAVWAPPRPGIWVLEGQPSLDRLGVDEVLSVARSVLANAPEGPG